MDLQGKTVLISGGTSGIGRATALMLARRGAYVLVLGRDPAKGAEVEAELRAASGGEGAFLPVDLSLIAATRALVADLVARLPRLDALIMSAGGIDSEGARTSEGLDKLFVTNFLHRLVLAEGLKPLLAAGQGRLVLVGGNVPDLVPLDWGNIEGHQRFSGLTSLVQIQGMALAMIQHLAAAWQAEGIEVTAIHPGLVRTNFFRSARAPHEVLASFVVKLISTSPEVPAKLLAWLAFSPEARGLSGQFFATPLWWGFRRKLSRRPADVARVIAAAHAALARVP